MAEGSPIDVDRLSALLASAKLDIDDALQALQGAGKRELAALALASPVNCSCNTGCACRVRAQTQA